MSQADNQQDLVTQNWILEANNQLLQTELDFLKQNFNYELDKKINAEKTLINNQNKKLKKDINALLLFLNKPLWGWFFRLNSTFRKFLNKYLSRTT